ncbi:MAG: putative LysR family transcriptional regulator [Actinomycetia bacterium]|nr:putative LysR family transcriptional regulator [Actinomycetes bacterium]
MAMDLRQLAALVAVAETGTFSAAADALHTVQSNVSTHVARLERELGATLVDRSAGRLTEEGELVVARARRIQAELDALAADVASLRHEVEGATRLGVIGTTARWLVPALLTAMEERHTKVRVTVLEGNTTSLLPQLAGGRVDLGVVNFPATDPEVIVEPLFEEDFIAVIPLGHPLSDAVTLTMADLADHELIMPPPGASIRVDLDRAAAAAGVTLRPRAELDGIRLIASMAFEGYGAAVLPSTAVPRWLTGDFRILPVEGLPRRQVGIGRRRRGLPSAPTRALTEVLRDVVRDVAGAQHGLHPSEG